MYLLLSFTTLCLALGCTQTGSIKEVVENERLKFIFVGGKGGVGKTTTSSALATLVAARRTGKVLLVSTDPAHSLSDAFKIQFSSEPQVVPGVEGMYDIFT
jgi:arsenite-transporting ATPase